MTTLAYSVEETMKTNQANNEAKASVDRAYAQGVSDALLGTALLCLTLYNLLRILAYLATSSGLF